MQAFKKKCVGISASRCETDVEVILERAKEKYPQDEAPDYLGNGPQFIARDLRSSFDLGDDIR